MGLLRRKKQPESRVLNTTRLANLPREDLYLCIETSLMEASMNLSKVRQVTDDTDRLAVLEWMRSCITTALLATEEYSSRI